MRHECDVLYFSIQWSAMCIAEHDQPKYLTPNAASGCNANKTPVLTAFGIIPIQCERVSENLRNAFTTNERI